jgi:acyl-CoA synthetase (AMP-forming)/AMP-acid ligase II/acyl carrier protein
MTRPFKQNKTQEIMLIDALYEHSKASPNRLAYACVSSEGALENALTYSDLIRRSESVATQLCRYCEPGDRAVLLFHGGPEFIVSFLGCLMAGVIAVPGYPVRVPASAALPARNYERLIPIIANAEPKVVLTTRSVVDRKAELSAAEPIFAAPTWLAVEEIPDCPLAFPPQTRGSDIAFLQYTSGSTSIPKGVMVSHANLASVFNDMESSWGHDDSSVMITWAPVFHDMGLIHGILFPLFFGFPVFTLMAAAVLQQPKRWLQAISRFRGTHSAGPNFILDLCLKRITEADRREVDLSSLRACLTGAEAVRHQTLTRFREAFAPCGLRPDAIQPGYGLAEFTLTVSTIPTGIVPRTVYLDAAACEQGRVVLLDAGNPRMKRSFVSCGWTHADSDIRIVDPLSQRECQPHEIGEIWARGQNLAQGYWRNPEATRTTMGACLADDGGPFLRTGDLGFIIDGELYIADRLKDLIIVRGRNLYPNDIEATVQEALPEVRVGRCCAFSIEREEGEALVIVAELDRVRRNNFDISDALARLREAISVQHEAEIYDAVFVRTGTFPLTSSGKVQRRQARQEYFDNRLQVIARIQEPPANASLLDVLYAGRVAELNTWLMNYLAKKLHQPTEHLSPQQTFQRLGLDSLSLVDMVQELEDFAGIALEPTIVFDQPNVELLSAYVTRSQFKACPPVAPATVVLDQAPTESDSV